MTPTCALIITKTRELLAATPDTTLSRVYTLARDAGITSAAGSALIEKLSAIRTHISNMPYDEVAKEFRNSVEAILSTEDERLIMDHCRYLTRGIIECSNTVQ